MTNDSNGDSPAILAARAAREPYTQARALLSQYALGLSAAMGFLQYHARQECSEIAAESLRNVEAVRDLLNTLTDHLTSRAAEESARAIDEWWDRQREAER
jgi:quinol monooxygenase YgiN